MIDREYVYHTYMDWVKQVSEKHPMKAGVFPREMVNKITEIIEKENPVVMDKRLIWQCKECEDVVVSYSHLIHDMNWCDCGKSAVDMEKEYSRHLGSVKEISLKEYKDGKWVKVEG